MLNPGAPKCDEDLITLETYVEQGNSVARDLPPTGSEANTTICYIYIYIYIFDIDSHCPYLLSGETTFHYLHVKIPYIYYLEKPPPIQPVSEGHFFNISQKL